MSILGGSPNLRRGHPRRTENPEGLADFYVWYIVVNNKTGHTGIYPSTWGEALIRLTGVSGANDNKFWLYQEAQSFTTGHDMKRLGLRFFKNISQPWPQIRRGITVLPENATETL
jgi:hypothetical protein